MSQRVDVTGRYGWAVGMRESACQTEQGTGMMDGGREKVGRLSFQEK
jgi:hypothetical protein